MPTYAQLQAESYWTREFVTDEIDWLGDELCRRTGRPRAAFGSKGDNAHLRGAHRSQEWIEKSRYCTSRTYTVQSGLTAEQKRHVAGVDFTPGSDTQMIAQCKRLLAAMKAGQLNEVVEFYGNVNGDKVVDGWDNIRDRTARSDSSHLWHWHLTIDRRHCRNRKLMERILAIALGDTLEDEMSATAERHIAELHSALLGPGSKAYPASTVQQIHDLAYVLVRGPAGSGAWVGGALTRIAEAAGISPAELEQITTAAREGAASAAAAALAAFTPAAIADEVVKAMPADQVRRLADELAARLAE